jgi:brefeldin A-inhibited guanine nucleotide-exchange protein
MSQGAFPDLVVCLTDFSKNSRFQKKSLQAIETLKGIIPMMLKTPECPLSSVSPSSQSSSAQQVNRQTLEEQYWFPVLFAFHDVLMTGDDLEVRSRSVSHLKTVEPR